MRRLLLTLLLAVVAAGHPPLPSPAVQAQSRPATASAVSVSHATPLPPVRGDRHFGVNESFRASRLAWGLGATWTRWIIEWNQIQPRSQSDWNQHYVDWPLLAGELTHGYKVAGLVKNTPAWAARDSERGVTSVPRGLDEPITRPDGTPNPANTWAWFVYWLAAEYKGVIDHWMIWNEVEIPPHGPNARYNTWAGTVEEYYQLLKVAHIAARGANPRAVIILSPYSYHRHKEWLSEFLAVAARDPAAARYQFFFDVLAVNLYRNPHDLYDRKVGNLPWAAEASDRRGFDQRLAEYGLTKPVWVAEVNAMPYDDPLVEGWDPLRRDDGFRITQAEQAAFVIQAYALGIAAGYDAIFWQAMTDDPPPVPDELWGLVRFGDELARLDETLLRPAYVAYQVAADYMSGADRVELRTISRLDPQGFRRFAPRYEWLVQSVVFQRGERRASVLWNSGGAPLSVAVPRAGRAAFVVDETGRRFEPARRAEGWVVPLAAARRHFDLLGGDPPGYFFVGGPPLILVEEGVLRDAPIPAPRVLPGAPPLLPSLPSAPALPSAAGYPVPGGRFYPLPEDSAWSTLHPFPLDEGFRVVDRANAPLWQSYSAGGAAPARGRPISRVFPAPPTRASPPAARDTWDGERYQATEYAVYRLDGPEVPEVDGLELALTVETGHWPPSDPFLRYLPLRPDHLPEEDGQRMALLDRAPTALHQALTGEPGWRERYGLPVAIADRERVIALRTDRALFLFWKDSAAVESIGAGALARRAGWVPPAARYPETAFPVSTED